jgi:hypothetical protein
MKKMLGVIYVYLFLNTTYAIYIATNSSSGNESNVALIGVIGGIIIAILTAVFTDKKTRTSLSRDHNDLSKEHSDLSKEHSDLSKEHGEIKNHISLTVRQEHEKLDIKIDNLKVIEKNINHLYYAQLNKEKLIPDNLQVNLSEISNFIQQKSNEVEMLSEAIEDLKGTITRKEKIISILQDRNEILKSEILSNKDEIEILSAKNDTLLKENRNLKNPKNSLDMDFDM